MLGVSILPIFLLYYFNHSFTNETVSMNDIQTHFHVILINDAISSKTHCWPWCFFYTGFAVEPPKFQHVSSHYAIEKYYLGT